MEIRIAPGPSSCSPMAPLSPGAHCKANTFQDECCFYEAVSDIFYWALPQVTASCRKWDYCDYFLQ